MLIQNGRGAENWNCWLRDMPPVGSVTEEKTSPSAVQPAEGDAPTNGRSVGPWPVLLLRIPWHGVNRCSQLDISFSFRGISAETLYFGQRRRNEVMSTGATCDDRQVVVVARFLIITSWNPSIPNLASGSISWSSHGRGSRPHPCNRSISIESPKAEHIVRDRQVQVHHAE